MEPSQLLNQVKIYIKKYKFLINCLNIKVKPAPVVHKPPVKKPEEHKPVKKPEENKKEEVKDA